MLTITLVRRLAGWLPPLVWAAFIFFLSALPSVVLPSISFLDELPAVAAHFILYVILMGLLERALRHNTNLSVGRARTLAFVLIAFYALSDEFHQTFVPGRMATLHDWLTDVIGAAFVWLALRLRPAPS